MRSGATFGLGLAAGALLALSAAMAADPPRRPPAASHGGGHSARPAAPQVPGPEIAYNGCAYFENANFTGRRVDVRAEANVEWLGREWSDRISSVACHSGCRLLGYEHVNYGGARRSFSGAVAAAGPLDEKISALRVICTAAPPAAPHGENHGSEASESH